MHPSAPQWYSELSGGLDQVWECKHVAVVSEETSTQNGKYCNWSVDDWSVDVMCSAVVRELHTADDFLYDSQNVNYDLLLGPSNHRGLVLSLCHSVSLLLFL